MGLQSPERSYVCLGGVCAVFSAHKAGPMPSCQLCKGPMWRSFLISPNLKVKNQGFGGMSSDQGFEQYYYLWPLPSTVTRTISVEAFPRGL